MTCRSSRGPPAVNRNPFLQWITAAGLALAVLCSDMAYAQGTDVTIMGAYIDQLGNPIPEATAQLFNEQGTLTDQSITDSGGIFFLSGQFLGIDDPPPVVENFHLSQNYPNPFNPTTRINLKTAGPGTITIYDLLGREIDRLSLSHFGEYILEWGGSGASAGTYIYTFKSQDGQGSKSLKMVLMDGGDGSPLRIVSESYQLAGRQEGDRTDITILREGRNINDYTIVFEKPNTTTEEISFRISPEDTTMFVTGNVAPTAQGSISAIIYAGQEFSVDLNDYQYNDSETIFTSRDDRLQITGSIATWTGVQGETIDTYVDLKDAQDPTLPGDSLSVVINLPSEGETTELTLILRDFYTQAIVDTGVSTFFIDDSAYTSTNGMITISVPQGVHEIYGTHENSLDGVQFWVPADMTGLTRPSDLKPFEKRGGFDESSPVLLGTEIDTIYVNEIMAGFPLWTAVTALGSPIVAFGEDAQDAPIWWDLNYLPPTDNQLRWIDDYRSQVQSIPYCTLELPLILSDQNPGVPYMLIRMDESFPSPGTNYVSWDPETYEIIWASARGPPGYFSVSKRVFFTEIAEAMFRGADDFPVLYNNGGEDVGFNETGRALIALSSYFGAGYVLFAPEQTNGSGGGEQSKPENTSSTLGDSVRIEYMSK